MKKNATLCSKSRISFYGTPFMERFAAAKKAGFDAVEFMFPYDYNQCDIKKQLTKTGLHLSALVRFYEKIA